MDMKCGTTVERNGSITQDGAILYEAESLAGLSRNCIKRLAELHYENPDLTWEEAEEQLWMEGYITK
jgi:hypothetical protein